MKPLPEELQQLIDRHAFAFANERELHDAIAQLFVENAVPFKREFRLDNASRPDFLVFDAVVVELKVGGPIAALTRQLHRYLQDERVTGALVVTSKRAHTRLPTMMSGKPVSVVVVSRV